MLLPTCHSSLSSPKLAWHRHQDLIKTVCTEKMATKAIVYGKELCYEVTGSAGTHDGRRIIRIPRCNNRHYRSSCRSRMYWLRKLILRDM